MVQKPLIKQGYSLAEEIANSVSHGVMLPISRTCVFQ